METLDAANRHRSDVGLPSIIHLESDKIKREEVEYQRRHSAAMVSPLHPYAGQPHSYSNHQSSSASTLPGPLGGLLSPPESRRTSGDEKEQQRGPARQSLPSIHEALGAEQSLSYPGPPPSAPVSAPPYHPRSTTVSPSDTRSRNFPTELHASQGPPNPFSHPRPRSPFMGAPTTTAPPPPPPPPAQSDSLPRSSFSDNRPPFSEPGPSFSSPRPSFSDPRPSFSEQRPTYPEPRPSYPANQHNPKLPTLHPLRTTQSPPPGGARPPYSSYPPQPSAYESSAPHSAAPMNPNYGYSPSQYPSNYPMSAPVPAPSGANSGYPPASTYSAPPRYPPPSWRSDNSDLAHIEDKKIGRSNLAPYGESVKRHLESFDLEASLNEMAEGSGRITDFSKLYRQRAHENQRIGMSPQSMPRLEEVDEMMKSSERIQVSLQRMRELVFNHQQANIAEPPQDARYRPMNGYDHDGPNAFAEDPKGGGGFAGADPKKRRGRAAPPGRCHSCNRAETPEWRRGPDGARTLCNACGLHYAKLTRKMGGKQAMTSSNLRPKSLDQGSPGA